ncbi:MAG: hypothetical protein K6A38_08130 [Lachnospiraceae bacterium]|nr:hypothetical protein [Lachnospiraceae bacterium]
MNEKLIKKGYRFCKYILFPLILIVLPLLKVNMGVDITDTTYSLGNYRDFGNGSGTVWLMLTFIPTVTGHLISLLPFASTMLGMKVYTSLLISLMALIGYRFFMTKMPSWLSFLSQLVAIGMCWAPGVVLYHYMTYFFMLLASILLFRGLAGTKREHCLFIAGILLGINTFVKFPGNSLEVLLIFALWFYGLITKKDFSAVFKQTLLCIAGYVASFVIIVLIIGGLYGSGSFRTMIAGVSGIAEGASDYTFAGMLFSIVDAYLHGFKWAIYMILCILPGIPFFVLWPGRFIKLRKVVYCVCIAFLFFVLGRWGMYNFRYYQKESALQWGAIFLLISLGITIWMSFTSFLNNDWKLIGVISLINILVLPLGSNNYIWPVLNSLFFIAPVTVWISYRFVRWGRDYLDETRKVPLFAVKAMLSGVIIAFFIQSAGLCFNYVFMDGEDGVKRDHRIEGNAVLAGMKTTGYTAENISGITSFMNENAQRYEGKKLLLYGDIPGMCYFLGKDCAISTTWPDLDSYPVSTMEKEIASIKGASESNRPLIAISKNRYDDPEITAKYGMIKDLIESDGYENVYENAAYVVFE